MRVAFSNAQKSWEESDDLVTSLATTLNALGHEAKVMGDWVEFGGFSLLPQIVTVEPLETSGVKTAITIQIAHDALIPGGIFEFQYSSGTDIRDSFAQSFKSWADLDLPVFLDAQRAKAATCMVMQTTPGSESRSVLPSDRRLVFGPTLQMAQNPDPAKDGHDFCPCCLFTNSIDAFDTLLKDKAFYGVRLFASRDADGHIKADCRVNGIDCPSGAEALMRYAKTWPDRGFEYRKQYVAIQTRAAEVVSGGREVGQHVTVPGG